MNKKIIAGLLTAFLTGFFSISANADWKITLDKYKSKTYTERQPNRRLSFMFFIRSVFRLPRIS